jgi:hypothetical protein
MEEIGPTHVVADPRRLKKIYKETGLDTVGKNFAEVRTDRRCPGHWWCRPTPNTWSQGPGDPGGPILKRPRKRRTLQAVHHFPSYLAALNLAQPTAQIQESLVPQAIVFEGIDDSPQSIAPQSIADEQTKGEKSKLTAQPEFHDDPAHRQIKGEEPQPVAQTHTLMTETLGKWRQTAATDLIAPGNQLRALAQPEPENTAVVCAYPYCRQTPEREEKLANPPQPIAEAELAQLISVNRILPHLGMANKATCRNLLDRNKYQGPGVPGALELASFLARHQDRSSWTTWGVVVKAVREDFMPWLYKTGWEARLGIWARSESAPQPAFIPTSESLADGEDASSTALAAETERLLATEQAAAQARREQEVAERKLIDDHQLAEKILDKPKKTVAMKRFWSQSQIEWATAINAWEKGIRIEHPGDFPEREST